MKKWKPLYFENSRIPVWLSYLAPIDIGAITLFFLVFSRGKMSEETKRHEYIHFQQMLETLVVGFVVLYIWDYLAGYIKYRHAKIAYHSIRAEQEAYHKASSPLYTHHRKRWRWLVDYKV